MLSAIVAINKVIPANLELHLSDEFERLQGKEADGNLKTHFQQKNLQREIVVTSKFVRVNFNEHREQHAIFK